MGRTGKEKGWRGRQRYSEYFAGKKQSLEVLESEPEQEDEVLEEDVPNGEDIQELSPAPDGSALELCQPKMKIFHGQTAPGLRIRSGPSFMVRLCIITVLFCCTNFCSFEG